MKNFPDHNQFDELERRLRDYTEQPDELVWENINTALRPDRTPSWVPWVDRVTSVASILLFAFVMVGTEPEVNMVNHDVVNTDEQDVMTSEKDLLSFGQDDDGLKSNDKLNRVTMESNTGSSKEVFPVQRTSNRKLVLGKNENDSVVSSAVFLTNESDKALQGKEVLAVPNSADSLASAIVTVTTDSVLEKHEEAESSRRIPKRRHKFYASVTPSLSFQRAIPVSDEIVVNDFLNSSILSGERFGFSIETGIQGYLAKRWEYYGGISFYRQNQTLKYSYQANNQVDVEPSGEDGYTVTPKSLEGSLNYEMINLGVQAGVLYNLYGRAKAIRHKFGAGVVYQHGLLKTESEQYNNAESSYFSYQIFYRNEVRVGRRWSVFVQPVFTQSFLVREKSDAPFNVKPYRAGIGFGVLYDF